MAFVPFIAGFIDLEREETSLIPDVLESGIISSRSGTMSVTRLTRFERRGPAAGSFPASDSEWSASVVLEEGLLFMRASRAGNSTDQSLLKNPKFYTWLETEIIFCIRFLVFWTTLPLHIKFVGWTINDSSDRIVRKWQPRSSSIYAQYPLDVIGVASSQGYILVASADGTRKIYDSQSGVIQIMIISSLGLHFIRAGFQVPLEVADIEMLYHKKLQIHTKKVTKPLLAVPLV